MMLNSSHKRWLMLLKSILLIVGVLAICCSKPAAQSKQQRAANNAAKAADDKGIFGDYSKDAPGVKHHITVADLPEPYASPSVDNGSRVVPRPDKAWPQAPAGFTVTEFFSGLVNPRLIRTAPNGDIFVAESQAGRIRVIRAADGAAKGENNNVFAKNLTLPFGIAFYPPGPNPQYIYIADTDQVLRIPYQNGDLSARSAPEVIVPDIPGGGHLRGGGHWTRDIAFSADGKQMFVSVGSMTNLNENNDDAAENRRADVLVFTPDGKNGKIYASGIRNAVGIAISPVTGELWGSVNERDGLGDNLVPDYITHIQADGFYGWPWYYIGSHQDPHHAGQHPELKNKVLVPDVLLQPHSASLEMTFYTGKQFPAEYQNDIFASEHGSWNRAKRTGYKVIRVFMHDGKATGEYQDFVTGFVTADGQVWGRPVGVTVAHDGALLITDDGSNTIWRVAKK